MERAELKAKFQNLISSEFFYLSIIILFAGMWLNFMSQSYLHEYIQEGQTLPVLSDLILNNIPYYDVDYLYDAFSIVGLIIFAIYILTYNTVDQIPYYLILFGVFHMIRALFIILTPFGNPPMFDGTETPFNGFSNYELGVYPSGHTGVSYLYFLLSGGKFRIYLFISFLVVVLSLFLARGHYSIDILSGVFFAYALKAYGDKHHRDKITV